MFTFWDYKRERWHRDAGLRLDHLLVSPDLAAASSTPGWTDGFGARPSERSRTRVDRAALEHATI